MSPSRQTLYNRRNDVARLQAEALPPLIVGHDGRSYTVARPGEDVLAFGRYEVIYHWLAGYRAGKLDAPAGAADTDR
jgi:hypothetical protein